MSETAKLGRREYFEECSYFTCTLTDEWCEKWANEGDCDCKHCERAIQHELEEEEYEKEKQKLAKKGIEIGKAYRSSGSGIGEVAK